MAIRLPLFGVLDYNDAGNVGASSTAGGVAKTFFLPQDTDNVVVKFTASTVGGGASALFQTTDDGGTTWYDVARTSVVSNTAGNTLAEWLTISTTAPGFRSTVIGQNSVAGVTNTAIALNTIGSAGASTLGSATQSGMPILGPLNRVFIQYTAAVSANALTRVQVKSNNQSATA